MPFFWIILSYLLGSIPFGYVIGIISGKNVLKVGWRKTSGSNVFKNVGKIQGVLTGILDFAKGYLAVLGANKLGLPIEVQILSGVAAVTGHNWSVFLKFAGGRGIGTFGGALLFFSPKLFLISLVTIISVGIIWNASIGTILLLGLVIFLSRRYGQFSAPGIFAIASLAPIFIKRLSPITEIKQSQNKILLIRNRLLFDDDIAVGSRIKRIIKSNPGRFKKIIKYSTVPVVVPSKMGWRFAKAGATMAKNGVKKLIAGSQEKIVTEITADDLKKMMISASKKIVLHQEEINRINVFPVADKDTGYNLAATLLGVEGTISQRDYPTMRELAEDIKEAAMVNARGNAGMIYTAYLIEVLDRVKHLETINAFHLGLAMERGINAARSSMAKPVEGTMLDVVKSAGETVYKMAKTKTVAKEREKNIIKILEEAQKNSEVALKETKEKLEVLKENDVVDAGALGFVKILESWVESLKGLTPTAGFENDSPFLQPGSLQKLEYKYEVVLSFKKTPEISTKDLKEELSLLGDSLEVIESDNRIKIHIHTNTPEAVNEKFKYFPGIETRVEDMEREIENIQKKPLGLIVDEAADLPGELLEKYGIEEVPFPAALTPSFKEFLCSYQKMLERFEKILAITVSSKLSGSYSSARIARSFFKKPKKLDIFVFDCFSAGAGEGLVAIRAQELISQNKKTEEIVEILKNLCPKVVLFACIDDLKYAAKKRRIKMPMISILVKPISLLQKFGLRLLLGIKNGKIKILGFNFGKNKAIVLAKIIDSARNGRKINVAITHADNPKEAEELKIELEKKPEIKVLYISSASRVVKDHTGSGALLAAFYPIDK